MATKDDNKAPDQTPAVVAPAVVPAQAPVADPPLEDVKVTKKDHRVKSSIGLNFARYEKDADGRDAYRQSHRLVDAGEVVKWEDFGANEAERKTTVERLLSLDAIEPVDDKDKK
jgi:hypothetical protein